MSINQYDISYCTACMNRISHVKKTLVRNIKDNEKNDNIEFVLLDYNSSDGLEKWVKSTLRKYIKTGKLKYFKTKEPLVFNRSHSRNIMFKLAQGKYICNVDADNYIGKGFTEYLLSTFKKHPNCFIVADTNREYYDIRDALGRFSCRKDDFLSVGGYDESFVGYGPEDRDLYARLEKTGLIPQIILNTTFLRAIEHGNDERVKNEFLYKELRDFYIAQINPFLSKILLLLKNNRYQYFEIQPTKYKSWIPISVVANSFDEGEWHIENSSLILNKNGFEKKLKSSNSKLIHTDNQEETIFYKNNTKLFRDKILIDVPLMLNQEKVEENKRDQKIRVNLNGYGKSSGYLNFSSKKHYVE